MKPKTHPLKRWIEKNTTQAKFARKVQCSESHLSDILSGKKGASLLLAVKMYRATGKDVPIDAIASLAPEKTRREEVPTEARV